MQEFQFLWYLPTSSFTFVIHTSSLLKENQETLNQKRPWLNSGVPKTPWGCMSLAWPKLHKQNHFASRYYPFINSGSCKTWIWPISDSDLIPGAGKSYGRVGRDSLIHIVMFTCVSTSQANPLAEVYIHTPSDYWQVGPSFRPSCLFEAHCCWIISSIQVDLRSGLGHETAHAGFGKHVIRYADDTQLFLSGEGYSGKYLTT